jgi:hypothetical protein
MKLSQNDLSSFAIAVFQSKSGTISTQGQYTISTHISSIINLIEFQYSFIITKKFSLSSFVHCRTISLYFLPKYSAEGKAETLLFFDASSFLKSIIHCGIQYFCISSSVISSKVCTYHHSKSADTKIGFDASFLSDSMACLLSSNVL